MKPNFTHQITQFLQKSLNQMLNHALYDNHILPTAGLGQYHGQTYLDITYNTVMKGKTTSDLDFTTYTPYLTVKHPLYGIYYDCFGEK